ncbi:TetR/AcrR family transcriptional regulator [Williamsia muralis]|uniref:TetR family transcriptional regulator n=1 Tax=Williamsia marianensis TaxID=85044 RepID=A0A2G3PGW7_WILMA|nr:TetR/AcrR family transcriptional regulator [Williamsia marianensis]PHV64983.1 TetR family transcriptional regulator [Williamsia marianensis]
MSTNPDVTPVSRPQRQSRPADRKRQLVDRAAELFLARGYDHVSVADIAKAAGVTGPSIYRHFADKQAILFAAVMSGVEDIEQCTDAALSPAADGQIPIGKAIEKLCALGVTNPNSAALWRWSTAHLTPEQNDEVARRTRTVLHRWSGAVFGHRTDLSPRDVDQLAWTILSVNGSVSVHRTRISNSRAIARLVTLVGRVVEMTPDHATAIAPLPAGLAEPAGRRDEILDAAAELFQRRGFATVGVDEIGEAVGITGPSVYKHFSSKQAILIAISQRSANRLEASAIAVYSVAENPAALLSLLVDSYIQVLTSTPDLSVSFNSRSVLEGFDNGELILYQRRYVARWVNLVEQIETDLPGPEAALTVHAALTIANDAMRLRRNWTRPEMPALLAYLMKGVLGLPLVPATDPSRTPVS